MVGGTFEMRHRARPDVARYGMHERRGARREARRAISSPRRAARGAGQRLAAPLPDLLKSDQAI